MSNEVGNLKIVFHAGCGALYGYPDDTAEFRETEGMPTGNYLVIYSNPRTTEPRSVFSLGDIKKYFDFPPVK